MRISNHSNKFYALGINLEDIEKAVLKSQAVIYKSSQMCESKKLHDCQKVFLVNKDSFLIAVKNILTVIKKKSVFKILTTKNF